MRVLQDWSNEQNVKQSPVPVLPQSDTATARTVGSVAPRGGGRVRPVSDGQSYRSGRGGSGRLRPAEPRPVRSPYDVGSRQRLSSSEQSPNEVCDLFSLHSYFGESDCKNCIITTCKCVVAMFSTATVFVSVRLSVVFGL